MNEVSSSLIEVNNNNMAIKKARKESQVSLSSASSYQSDSSEEALLERKSSAEDIIQKAEDIKLQTEYKKCRSLSDGAAVKLLNKEYEIFPSLPNAVLEKMGLFGDSPRVRLNEEELEQKFTSLALAFTIDATTIKDRCERQRRYRDRTETNLSVEIERLKDKLALIQPLCTDSETVDLLSTLLTQVEIIMKAATLVTISAERYGSVQHEERLSESVQVMISHVQMLKQQRDSARRQLQYTKRVLQNPPDSPVSSPTNPHKTSLPSPTRKVIGKRRASIASIAQPVLENKAPAEKKVTRRISDLSLRATSLTRIVRPSKLELVGDLVKINEGFLSEAADVEHHHEENDPLIENNHVEDNQHDVTTEAEGAQQTYLEATNLSLSGKILYRFRRLRDNLEDRYEKWTDNGTIHEICCFCALLCFSISLLMMVNILIEHQYAKRGWGNSHFFWFWSDGQR